MFFVTQGEPDRSNLRIGAGTQICNCAVLNLAVFSIALPEKIASVGFVSLFHGRGIDIHSGYLNIIYKAICQVIIYFKEYFSGYIFRAKKGLTCCKVNDLLKNEGGTSVVD